MQMQLEEETHFVRLFDDVVEQMRSGLVDEQEMEIGEETVRTAFWYNTLNEDGLPNTYWRINFNLPRNQYAYVYRYSPQSAGLSRLRTLEAVQQCQLLQDCLIKGVVNNSFPSQTIASTLNIMSVGGGSGADMFGFLSAIYDTLESAHSERKLPLNLNLTVIDHEASWIPFMKETLVLIKSGSYGCVSRMFKDADLNIKCKFASKDVRSTHTFLQSADIVLMTRVLSSVPGDQIRSIKEFVARNMKRGSLLLLIDNSEYSFDQFGLQKILDTDPDDYVLQAPPIRIFGAGIAQSSKANVVVHKKPVICT